MSFTVAQAAAQVGISAHTLRFYAKQGLLPFVQRSAGGIRLFTQQDIEWLELIQCLKNTGMTLKDIKYFADCAVNGDESIAERLAIFEQQRMKVQQQIQELKGYLKVIAHKCEFYQRAQQLGSIQAALAEIPDGTQNQ